MNILIVISSLSYGGAEKQAVIDANLLSGYYNVSLCYFHEGPLRELINEKVKTICIQKGIYPVTALRLRKIAIENQIQIIHASLFASMIISALSSGFSDRKILWHFHSHEYDLPFLNRLLLSVLSRLPSVRKLIFVSTELRIDLTRRFRLPDSKTDLLYNTSSLNPVSNVKKDHFTFTIGYIGRLVELKRVHLLVEAATFLLKKGFADFHMMIIGDGQERLMLEELTKKNGVETFFEFTGFQSDTEKYYNEMDIFALPSGEECLSMSAIDAGVKGIPIVAFDVGGNSEIIDSGNTGYIVTTKEEFFEKIYYLAVNKIIREQMGEAAYIYCSDKFGKEKHLAQLNALYEELCRKYN